MISNSQIFEVYKEKKRLFTKNLTPGYSVYGEDLRSQDQEEYREWDPSRSKLAAYIAKGCQQIGMRRDSVVLYLGASSGTTASHVSDIVGSGGFVFALEFAPRITRQLVGVCEQRPNMAPLLADARHPASYAHRVCLADTIYQDLAQSDQAEIFVNNCSHFLKTGGFGLLAVKARSIDIRKDPKQVYKAVREKLERELTVIDSRTLQPFEQDHCIFMCKKKD